MLLTCGRVAWRFLGAANTLTEEANGQRGKRLGHSLQQVDKPCPLHVNKATCTWKGSVCHISGHKAERTSLRCPLGKSKPAFRTKALMPALFTANPGQALFATSAASTHAPLSAT
eukprot:1477297-Amphidinium_carterae.1